MAKKKADLIAEAQAAGLDVGDSNTVSEIKEALKEAESKPTPEETLKTKKAESKKAKSAEPAEEEVRDIKPAKEDEKEPDTEESKRKAAAAKREQQKRRSRLERRGKQYRKAHELLNKTKEYELEEAIKLLPKTSFVKFDAAVEIHINLGIDPKQADQTVRGTVALPHGSGKSQRVAVLAEDADQKKAKDAGADVVGDEKLLADIKKEKFDFDILVATPPMMTKLGQYAKILGPKGLMPNPKSGTVTSDISKVVRELKAGRIEFRNDPAGIIHQVIGKVSYKLEQLTANAKALLSSVTDMKPDKIKGTYVQKIWLTTSMGPSIKVNVSQALKIDLKPS